METWVPIMDYAIRNGMSISTVRRRIKGNHVKAKQENGRYLICEDMGTDGTPMESGVSTGRTQPGVLAFAEKSLITLKELYNGILVEKDMRIKQLETELQEAKSDLAEMQMLVSVLEEKKF